MPKETSVYEQGGGYVGSEPSASVVREVLPAPKSSQQQSDYLIPMDEEYTVYTGNLPATFRLMEATGSRRVHTIVRAGSGALTVSSGPISSIGATNAYSVAQWCSLSVLDYLEGRWVGTSSIVPETVVVSGTTVADSDHVMTGTRNQAVNFSSITANRTVTLPPAATAGQSVSVQDASGSCAWGKKIIITAAGTDKIHGTTTTSISIWVGYGAVILQSDGTGKWFIIARAPKVWYVRWTADTTYTPDPDAMIHRFIGVGAGASGGNAHTVYGGGGGGGAGNVGEWEGSLPVGTPVTITVGAAGAARAIGANLDGQDGGNSSIGSYLVCYGGKGGKKPTTVPGSGGISGAAQARTSLELLRSRFVVINLARDGFDGLNEASLGSGGTGSDGGANPAVAGSGGLFPATYLAGAAGSDANSCAAGGGGASSAFGAGGKGGECPVAGQPVVAGVAGTGFGSGGGGAATTATADGASGAGAPGVIDCWVYF